MLWYSLHLISKYYFKSILSRFPGVLSFPYWHSQWPRRPRCPGGRVTQLAQEMTQNLVRCLHYSSRCTGAPGPWLRPLNPALPGLSGKHLLHWATQGAGRGVDGLVRQSGTLPLPAETLGNYNFSLSFP